jgi:alkylhydroperoxidase family enzyme
MPGRETAARRYAEAAFDVALRDDSVAAWREAPCYSERERAALAWTEHLTLVAHKGPSSEEIRAALAAQFSQEEQVKLTMMINVINDWNRLAVGFGLFEASYGWKE